MLWHEIGFQFRRASAEQQLREADKAKAEAGELENEAMQQKAKYEHVLAELDSEKKVLAEIRSKLPGDALELEEVRKVPSSGPLNAVLAGCACPWVPGRPRILVKRMKTTRDGGTVAPRWAQCGPNPLPARGPAPQFVLGLSASRTPKIWSDADPKPELLEL